MSLSPREQVILENIESLLQGEDPELAARLTGMRGQAPARPARWMLPVTVLSIVGGLVLMIVAAISANPIVAVTGVGSAVIVPIVVGVWYFRDRRRLSGRDHGAAS